MKIHANKFRRLLETLSSCAEHSDVYFVEVTAMEDDLFFDFQDEDGDFVFHTRTLKEA